MSGCIFTVSVIWTNIIIIFMLKDKNEMEKVTVSFGSDL